MGYPPYIGSVLGVPLYTQLLQSFEGGLDLPFRSSRQLPAGQPSVSIDSWNQTSFDPRNVSKDALVFCQSEIDNGDEQRYS